jgi:hypothetical protein
MCLLPRPIIDFLLFIAAPAKDGKAAQNAKDTKGAQPAKVLSLSIHAVPLSFSDIPISGPASHGPASEEQLQLQ